MKSFANRPGDVVDEAIEGLCTHAGLTVLDAFPKVRVVCRDTSGAEGEERAQVAVISGGGSGHEPAHAGFVGEGMLSAAVCGNVFASPSVDAVLSAILATSGEAGCLLIIKNYTGDRLNFGLAAEQAREAGIPVETVVVGDDVALGTEGVQQRGIAGTVFVHKVAGYYAAQGAALEEVRAMAQRAADRTRSIGLALREGRVPGTDEASRLDDDEVELGLGIHGEPGAEVIEMAPADALMARAAEVLASHLPGGADTRYALMLNSMGGTSPLEMQVLQRSFHQTDLAEQVDLAVNPGPLMTSLDMQGFSISLLALDDDLRPALEAPAVPAAWSTHAYATGTRRPAPELPETLPFAPSTDERTRAFVEAAADELQAAEEELNELDRKVGDADAGTTFAAIGRCLKAEQDALPYADPASLFTSIGRLLAREVGGSSGVLLSILFASAGQSAANGVPAALRAGLERMKEVGGAQRGDRTMIDAMEPAFEALDTSLEAAARDARAGADATAEVTETQAGRSSYLAEEELAGVPDPGAEMTARVFETLAALR